jgi:hypothetical protein
VAHQELLDHLGQDQQLEQVVQERLQVSQVRQLPTPVAVAQVLQMAEPAHQVEQVAAAQGLSPDVRDIVDRSLA